MFNFMLDDKTLTILLWGGSIFCVCIPAIHFALAHFKRKREEEKERQMILKQFVEERKNNKKY